MVSALVPNKLQKEMTMKLKAVFFFKIRITAFNSLSHIFPSPDHSLSSENI